MLLALVGDDCVLYKHALLLKFIDLQNSRCTVLHLNVDNRHAMALKELPCNPAKAVSLSLSLSPPLSFLLSHGRGSLCCIFL